MATRLLTAFALAAALAGAAPAAAQLPSASSAGLGMAENFTAAARGYHAIAWNPANLALSGNPGASLAFFPVRAVAGLGPVDLGDLKQYGGKYVPTEVRSEWLQRISLSKQEQGDVGADVTFAAVQVGPVGFQLSTSIGGTMRLTPDVARLVLFGNSENGQAQAFNLKDARVNGAWTSTGALSYARAFPAGQGARVSVGAALKYTLGHVLAYGRDQGSTLSTSPIIVNVNFPVISTDTAALFNNGSGLGLDLGAAYEAGKLTVSGALQNVYNGFKWDRSKLAFRPATAFVNADSISTGSFDEQDLSKAPAELVSRALALRFKPVILAGAAYRVNQRLLVDADIHQRLGDDGGMQYGPETQVGAGAEYRPLSFLPLRAGAAYVTGGSQFAGGFGIEIGTFSLNASIARRSDDVGTSTISMITLISSFPR